MSSTCREKYNRYTCLGNRYGWLNSADPGMFGKNKLLAGTVGGGATIQSLASKNASDLRMVLNRAKI